MYGSLYPQECSTVPSKVQALIETFYSTKMKLLWGKNFKSHKCGVASNIVWCESEKEMINSM